MTLKLPDSMSSPQDLMSVILELQEYSRWFAHESIKKRVNAKAASTPPAISPAAEQLLRDASGKQPLSQQAISTLITMLKDYSSTAPTITLTLAAPPTGGIKTTLVTWCRNNIAPNVLVNFQFNATLLGGMVVRYGSHVHDWSFRRQILDARSRFPEVLRNV